MKKCIAAFCFLSIFSLFAQNRGQYKKISADEAKKMMETGTVTVVDVRTPEEYADGHIPGALLLPDYEISAVATKLLPDKTATILVYCRTGRRSAGAAKKLISLGYTAVYDFGGIVDWNGKTVK